jgi:hypothetical protein
MRNGNRQIHLNIYTILLYKKNTASASPKDIARSIPEASVSQKKLVG